MAAIPPALILVNQDLTDNVQEKLVRQLFIDNVLTGSQFDTLITNNPNFTQTIKQLRIRVLVIRPLDEYQNRELFDIVLFIKAGLAAVECNKFGPHGLTLPVINLYWGALGIF